MPADLKKEVDMAIKEGKYASTSEFFRVLIRMWKDYRLLSELRESEREFKAGKGKILTLKELRRYRS